MIQVHNLNEVISDNLKRVRTESNLTQEQLAERLDMGVDNYRGYWERGKKNIDIQDIILLAASLKKNPVQMFEELTKGVF